MELKNYGTMSDGEIDVIMKELKTAILKKEERLNTNLK